VAGVLVVIAATVAARGDLSPASSSSAAVSPTGVPRGDDPPARVLSTPAPPTDGDRSGHLGALGEADGAVPDGTTVFNDELPAVARLDPALLGALRRAATRAAADGVDVYVDSAWRSPKYQAQLLREAIAKYGSEHEAARWVATPETSLHVSGEAVDIGHADATAWLSGHGARYGLCPIYRNEPWHFELRPNAIDHGCPPMYADPTRDPRMQQ
jgi:D-alanyl-D-alanine carboxypeptidase